MADAFNGIYQERISCPVADTWVPVVINPGSRNALIVMEDDSVKFRLSFDNTLDATTQGIPMDPGSSYYFEGVNSVHLTVYISSAKHDSFVILHYTKE
jgi:hypothetical protein